MLADLIKDFNELMGLVVRHETVFFLIAGGLVESLIMKLLPRLRAVLDRATQIRVDPGAVKMALKVLPLGLFALAVTLGNKEAIPKTTALSFPKPICDHHGSKLLIFLHGWKGDSTGTWQNFPKLACADLDLSDTTVLSLDYPVYISNRNLLIGQLAAWINARLVANGVSRYKRIAIISHSMGGLVARKMILERRDEVKVGLLIEEGVPHDGAANYTQLIRLLGLKGSDVVDEMLSGSEFLIDLQDGWNHLEQRPHNQCYTSSGDEVVSRSSAILQCEQYDYYVSSVDHIGLVKPDDDNDDRYRMPIGYVKHFMQDPKE